MGDLAETVFQQRWQVIQSHRQQLLTALLRYGSHLSRPEQRTLQRLEARFSSCNDYQTALQRPDVLTVVKPLIAVTDNGKLSDVDIERAVRLGFLSISSMQSASGRIIYLFFYPAIILAEMAAIAVVFSYTLIPAQQMLANEIYVQLPFVLTSLNELAWLIRTTWCYVLAGAIVFMIGGLYHSWRTRNRRLATESWFADRIKTPRDVAADWAWHVALLLEFGLDTRRAVSLACQSQNREWLTRNCHNWLNRLHNTTSVVALEMTPAIHQSYLGFRFPMMDLALDANSTEAKIDLLRELAVYCWSSSRATTDWLIRWAVSIFLWLCLGLMVTTIAAFYSVYFSLNSYFFNSL